MMEDTKRNADAFRYGILFCLGVIAFVVLIYQSWAQYPVEYDPINFYLAASRQEPYLCAALLPTSLVAAGVLCRTAPVFVTSGLIALLLGLQGLIRPVTSTLLFPLALGVSYLFPKNNRLVKTGLTLVL